MKRLSTIVLILMAGASMLGLISCDPADMNNATNYYYINKTDKPIYILTSSVNMITNETLKQNYTIGLGDTMLLGYATDHYEYPFCLFLSDQANCKTTLEIRNAQPYDYGVKVIQSSPEGSLFNLSNYTITKEGGGGKEYEFAFTEDFFKDGVPIK